MKWVDSIGLSSTIPGSSNGRASVLHTDDKGSIPLPGTIKDTDMENSPKVKAALEKAFKDLMSLSRDELLKLLDNAEERPELVPFVEAQMKKK